MLADALNAATPTLSVELEIFERRASSQDHGNGRLSRNAITLEEGRKDGILAV
jgi:hypothetical protein